MLCLRAEKSGVWAILVREETPSRAGKDEDTFVLILGSDQNNSTETAFCIIAMETEAMPTRDIPTENPTYNTAA